MGITVTIVAEVDADALAPYFQAGNADDIKVRLRYGIKSERFAGADHSRMVCTTRREAVALLRVVAKRTTQEPAEKAATVPSEA